MNKLIFSILVSISSLVFAGTHDSFPNEVPEALGSSSVAGPRMEGYANPAGEKTFSAPQFSAEQKPQAEEFFNKVIRVALMEEALREAYHDAKIDFRVVPNVSQAATQLSGQRFPADMDAFTLSAAVIKKDNPSAAKFEHMVLIDDDLFKDPAKMIAAMNHEFFHILVKDQMSKAGNFKADPEEEVKVLKMGIASLQDIAKRLKAVPGGAMIPLGEAIEARIPYEEGLLRRNLAK